MNPIHILLEGYKPHTVQLLSKRVYSKSNAKQDTQKENMQRKENKRNMLDIEKSTPLTVTRLL